MTEHSTQSDADLVRFWNDGDGSIGWLTDLEAELQSRGYVTRSSNPADGQPRVGGERLVLRVLKNVEYRAVWGGGGDQIIGVRAPSINEGFVTALALAVGRWEGEEPNSDHDLNRVEFWQVKA